MASVAETAAYRDFSMARMFELALATIRCNPSVTLALALLFGTIPGLVANYFVSRVTDDAASSGDAILWALYIFTLYLNCVLSGVTQAFQARATIAQAEGRQPGFAECARAGAAVSFPAAGLALMVSIPITLGYAMLLVPGLFLGALWYVAIPAMVEERRGVVASLRRSHALTYGARWKIFALLAVALVLSIIVMVAVEVASGQWDSQSLTAAYSNPAYLVLSITTFTAMNLFWGAVQASLYVQLRNWKDGPRAAELEQVFG